MGKIRSMGVAFKMVRRTIKVLLVFLGIPFLPYLLAQLCARHAGWLLISKGDNWKQRESLMAYLNEHTNAHIWAFGIIPTMFTVLIFVVGSVTTWQVSQYIRTGKMEIFD